jgi:ubiquinone/menaquinone biosynthesis C-methylase UbiE
MTVSSQARHKWRRDIRRAGLPEQIPKELAENLAAYRSSEAVANLSFYRLYQEEEQLFSKYYTRGESILDLACGMGRTTLLLHEMGFAVRGVDRSDVFIQLAKRRLPYLDLQMGSYDHIEEPDESFSHVLISLNGIDYAYPMAQRVQAIRECARVLKPGGTFIYCSHNIKSLHLYSPYYGNRKRWKLKNCLTAFTDWAYIDDEGLHTFYATPKVIIEQTEPTGLSLVEMRWFSKYGHERIDRFFSPYIYYVFTKPKR